MSLSNQFDSRLWAITTYFNPLRYASRIRNYRVFRRNLNVPLIAVELHYGDHVELDQQDAEILIQLRGRDVMWQKERLLNIALDALPDHCQAIAWLDSDLIYERDDWADAAISMLEHFPLVHAQDKVYDLPKGEMSPRPAILRELAPTPSFVPGWRAGTTTRQGLQEVFAANPKGRKNIADNGLQIGFWGLGWLGRRELFNGHGFYDACVIGGGDGALASAAIGTADLEIKKKRMNQRQAEHYLNWAEPFYASVRDQVGVLKGGVFHLWHGDLRDRSYRQRHREFVQFQFDPYKDIAVDANGCWRWNSDKPEMHRFLQQYFESRHEDGQ